jgi:hypothetical protein
MLHTTPSTDIKLPRRKRLVRRFRRVRDFNELKPTQLTGRVRHIEWGRGPEVGYAQTRVSPPRPTLTAHRHFILGVPDMDVKPDEYGKRPTLLVPESESNRRELTQWIAEVHGWTDATIFNVRVLPLRSTFRKRR